ncbi:uncharacterized protein LOC110029411 [Phalaenopsis equestris]|uniref:uncharacterized protein LOC110029411 n=1 Tax=Phalaenopsis equestris TaxID=78828 RepID=UPI0009E317A5|nr:uncharacterized protein LOC110029411 [Phalaenopsis equestris]
MEPSLFKSIHFLRDSLQKFAMRLSIIPILDALARRTFTSAGLRPESITINSETTIHCWLPPSLPLSSPQNPNNQISKPSLLLIHGFGPVTTWQWRAQVRALSRHFDLIVPDLIFFGRSTTTSPERSELFQASMMVALLKSLGVSGESIAGIVGTSYGGFVAYHAARMMGEEWTGKLVIASSDLEKKDEDDRALMERVGGIGSVVEIMLPRTTDDLRKLLKISVRRPPRFPPPEFLLRDVLRNLYQDNMERKIELLKGVTLGNKDLFQLTPLRQEVLILWGEHDGIFPVIKAFQLKKKLGEKVKLKIFKNTGHVPQLEAPDEFNKVLLSFLLGSPNSTL